MNESNCVVCGKLIKFNPKVQIGKFCSNKCQGVLRSATQTEANKKLLLDGKLTDISRLRIKKTMKALGIEDKCAICSITSWCGKPLPFILDHIDGDSTNNNINNLRLICSNCDSQTDTYKGKNKGSGTRSKYLPKLKPGSFNG